MLPMSRIFRCSHAFGSAIPRDAMCSSVMSFDCSSVKYADFRPSWRAFWYRIENARDDFMVPGAPLTRTMYPSGMPLARMSSKPRTYVLTRFRSVGSLRGPTNARPDLSLSPRKSRASRAQYSNRLGPLGSALADAFAAVVATLRVIGALVLLFFLPGWLLINALYPRKGELDREYDALYRLTLGIVLSIAVTVFWSFFLNSLGVNRCAGRSRMRSDACVCSRRTPASTSRSGGSAPAPS